jgi:hypothetical protein
MPPMHDQHTPPSRQLPLVPVLRGRPPQRQASYMRTETKNENLLVISRVLHLRLQNADQGVLVFLAPCPLVNLRLHPPHA